MNRPGAECLGDAQLVPGVGAQCVLGHQLRGHFVGEFRVEAAREAAHKRAAEEIAQLDDVPELMMPPEVSKRLRSGEASSLDDTSGSGGNGAR